MNHDETASTEAVASDRHPKQLDWKALRELSLQPGGFGSRRIDIWPQLLNVERPTRELSKPVDVEPPAVAHDDTSPAVDETVLTRLGDTSTMSLHRDERQIQLDTDRSFVLYPVDNTQEREHLQAQLNELIVAVFRKRHHLSYFQGYHDVISVIYLTLPRELQLSVAEKISLHRLRDSMGVSLEPVVGLLRLLKRIIQLSDPELAAVLERNAPLPYYALSNLLTLLSHDVPTLPLIQHVFDYLLARPPIALVYLAAAVILMRREEVMRLEREGGEGMIHSLLTSLPDLYEEAGDKLTEEDAEVAKDVDKLDAQDTSSAKQPAPEETSPGVPEAISGASQAGEEGLIQNTASSTIPSVAPDDAEIQVPSPDLPASQKDEAKAVPAEDVTEPQLPEKQSESIPPSPTSSVHPSTRPRISLSSLLRQADELYSRFLPSHPDVALSSIMGPQSVMLTWSEDPSELPEDDEAELMVLKPELVVLPHVEQDDEVASDEEDEKSPRSRRREEKERGRRRKLQKPRRMGDVVLQRKTMVAGAVLVLGVAMAVYGIQSGGAANMFGIAGNGHRRHHLEREWRRLSGFVGGAVIGVGERVFGGFLH
ncbi:hypothetical protein OBBRIDRAFT_828297 [Obba rivulosa]|uniref:Rab-GAP TBC domain-containing protein n=1 Tax=Obba rivulosa TaxID=1052685 RepID=A0A8E2DL42_9APHY|nr:hypothetical protein OBBRIDRAFT_828297 [Obba rivulosa]